MKKNEDDRINGFNVFLNELNQTGIENIKETHIWITHICNCRKPDGFWKVREFSFQVHSASVIA